MALFRRPAPDAGPERRSLTWAQLGAAVAVPGSIDVGPSLDKTLKNAASWACIDVLVDAISRTPFDPVRSVDGVRQPVTPVPRIISDPSGVVDDDVWLGQLSVSLLSDGNAFGLVTDETTRGLPTQIDWLDPSTVVNRRFDEQGARVDIPKPGGGTRTEWLWPLGRVFHIPGRIVPPGTPYAVSPMVYANRTIGTSLSVEQYCAGFFEGGGHPTAIVTSDQDLDAAQSEQIKEKVRRLLSGSTREPLVMGSGLTYDTVQTPPGETQFLELLRFTVEQACRFWRVPPGMVYLAMAGSSVTYQNITDADLMLLKYSLDGYLRRIEKRWSKCLPSPQVVKANRDAILRADVKARYSVHETALRNRIRSVNEVRRLEDEPPFADPAFDEPGIPPFPPASPVAPSGAM